VDLYASRQSECIEVNELKDFNETTETEYHSINHLKTHRAD